MPAGVAERAGRRREREASARVREGWSSVDLNIVCVCVCVPNGYTGGRQWSNDENGDLDHDWWEKKMILLREKRYDLDYM